LSCRRRRESPLDKTQLSSGSMSLKPRKRRFLRGSSLNQQTYAVNMIPLGLKSCRLSPGLTFLWKIKHPPPALTSTVCTWSSNRQPVSSWPTTRNSIFIGTLLAQVKRFNSFPLVDSLSNITLVFPLLSGTSSILSDYKSFLSNANLNLKLFIILSFNSC